LPTRCLFFVRRSAHKSVPTWRHARADRHPERVDRKGFALSGE
jgi:hypothetical protein